MPRISALPAALAATLTLSVGCASFSVPQPSWPTFASSQAPPGTAQWWKKNKKKAELVAKKGFRVDGVEGYFDADGRPIDARVAKVVNRKESKGLLGDVQFIGAVDELKQQVGLGPDEQLARKAFADGEDLFRRERYSQAAKRFKETVARWPDSQIEQDAMFQMAESHFFAERYPAAVDAYEALIQKYPNTIHLDKTIRRQFSLAQYWERYHQYNADWPTTPNFFDRRRPLFDTLGRSLKVYENIRLNDPTGPLADDSIMATANSYFLRGRYVDADQYYDLLRKEYPRSEHQYEAHLLGLQCKLRKYQ
ncbi:MAG: tetratricopeptide repeat protein, partial [Planctomycetota bacterium]